MEGIPSLGCGGDEKLNALGDKGRDGAFSVSVELGCVTSDDLNGDVFLQLEYEVLLGRETGS